LRSKSRNYRRREEQKRVSWREKAHAACNQCDYCNCVVGPDNWSVDHIIPVSMLVANYRKCSVRNYAYSCIDCNSFKDSNLLVALGLKLIRKRGKMAERAAIDLMTMPLRLTLKFWLA
jgi:hypothetical protein